MNLLYIQRKIEKILNCEGDAELSHGMEDDLNESFIVYIASLTSNTLADEREEVVDMAEALKELIDKKLDRWYA